MKKMTRKIRNRKTRNRKIRNRKYANSKYANRKLIKNKRITRKKKTKTKQIGGFKQNGGKINFCYDSGDSGSTSLGLKAYKYIDFNTIYSEPPKCPNNTSNIDSSRYISEQIYYPNPGNYCYAITAIQMLRNIDNIVDLLSKFSTPIIGNTENIKTKIFIKLQEILKQTTTDNTNKLLAEIATLTFPNNSMRQQDIDEFITFLNLDEIMQLVHYEGQELYSKDNAFIKKVVSNKSINKGITALTFDINKNSFRNIQEIFLREQQATQQDYENSFKDDTTGITYPNYIKYPKFFVKKNNQYLFISLKIFNSVNKIQTKTKITITTLNDNLCIRYLKPEDSNENDDETKTYQNGVGVNYELISIGCHLGINGNSGHYANFSKQIINGVDLNNPKWVYYNDSGNNSFNTIKFTNNTTQLHNVTNIYYLNDLNDINLIDQTTFSPYLFLYQRLPPSTASA